MAMVRTALFYKKKKRKGDKRTATDVRCDYIIAPFLHKIQRLMYNILPTNSLCQQFCGIILINPPQLFGISTEISVRGYNGTDHSLLGCS